MSRISLPRERIAELCKHYGPTLNGLLPKDIDGAQLLWAISGNEGSFGSTFGPHHERSYCYLLNGDYSTKPSIVQLTKDYNCLAHCSIGPWQVMAINLASMGFCPMEVFCDETQEKACMATVAFLRNRVLPGAHSLDDIADEYNTGSLKGVPPAKYIADLHLHYLVPIPEGVIQ